MLYCHPNRKSLQIQNILEEDMFWLYDSNKGGSYKKPIPDAENPITIDLLTVSSNFSNAKSTQMIINKAIHAEGLKFTIGCKLRKIP